MNKRHALMLLVSLSGCARWSLDDELRDEGCVPTEVVQWPETVDICFDCKGEQVCVPWDGL